MRTVILFISIITLSAVALSMAFGSGGPAPEPQSPDSPVYHIVHPFPPDQNDPAVPDTPSIGAFERYSVSDVDPEESKSTPYKKYYPKVPPDPPGRDPYFHHQSIQQAINYAVNGDVVIVTPGVYRENIDFIGKAITVKSLMGPEVTLINGKDFKSVVTFQQGETVYSKLEGFTIYNGAGTYLMAGLCRGGGVLCMNGSSPDITGNIIEHNRARGKLGAGGGIAVLDSSHPMIRDNLIRYNKAGYGGGLYLEGHSAPWIQRNNIVANSANAYGGGLSCFDCGIAFFIASPILTENAFHCNTASVSGGGIHGRLSRMTIVNNSLFMNKANVNGGGMSFQNSSDIEIANTIIWGNDAPFGPQLALKSSAAMAIDFSDVEEGLAKVDLSPNAKIDWGVRMLDVDPIFIDLGECDLHVSAGSPCRDMGNPDECLSITDWEGDRRIVNGKPDMGADEQWVHLYCQDDHAMSGDPLCTRVVGPAHAPAILWVSMEVLSSPTKTPYGMWYLDGILVTIDLGKLSAKGAGGLDTHVPAGLPDPVVLYLQALVDSELTNMLRILLR